MATVIFYEKPGCINNTKQKALLRAAGHEVDDRNLLTEAWTGDRLRRFFGDRPVAEWFNPTAPAVKSGQVRPDRLDAETALALMLQDPLLIRRPLMQASDRCEVGFDVPTIERWLGLEAASPERQGDLDRLARQDLQTCPTKTAQHALD